MNTAPHHVTSLDVARAAGVSRSTVSRILNGSASEMVSEATRQRVLRLAAEMGYVPNAAARQLRMQQARALGLMLPPVTHGLVETYSFGQLLTGVAEEINAAAYSLVLCPSASESQAVRMWQTKQVDGVLAMHPHRDDRRVMQLARWGAPVVLMNEVTDGPLLEAGPVNWVDVDNVGGARSAVSHLLERGHRRIAMIAGRPGYAATSLRVQGYRSAHEAFGLVGDPGLEVYVPEPVLVKEGAAAMRQLLAIADPPTAVFCSGDLLAYGAMHAIEEAGLRVPGDIAVVGFDDEPANAFVRPSLTTVRVPFRAKGRAAARMLIDLVEGRLEAPASRKLAAELVVRESSRPLLPSLQR